MATQFAFVSYGADGKQKSSSKSQVRSHCMKGRNKRDGSRRSTQQAKRSARGAEAAANNIGTNIAVSDTFKMSSTTIQRSPDLESASLIWMPPSTVFRSSAPIRFPHVLGQMSEAMLRQVITFDQITETCYPVVDTCVEFADEQDVSVFDEAFLHTILLTTLAVHDMAQNLPLTTSTRFHLGHSLTLVNRKLASGESHLDDSTLYTVLLLAIIAGSVGESSACTAHLTGLERLVELRGGDEFLARNIVFKFKLECLDLMWCLAAGEPPHFLHRPVSWDTAFTRPSPPIDKTLSSALLNNAFDPRLIIAFQDLQRLMELVNMHQESGMRLGSCHFQPVLSSIQTRLLELKDVLFNTSSEWLCLGLLAFLTTMFQVPGKRMQYHHLAARFRCALRHLATPLTPDLRLLVLWLVIVCGATIMDIDEPWLRSCWNFAAEPNLSWGETRKLLRSVMWIHCVHDGTGRRVFAALTMRP